MSHDPNHPFLRFSRRGFLGASAASVTAIAAKSACATEPPTVENPRATDGDDRHQPNWDERLEVTVGRKSGDLQGASDRVIQAAIDYVANLGGGTVKLLPGVYTLRNAVQLRSHVRLLGSGAETVITKIASASTALAADSDWYDQEITLKDPASFRIGDAVTLQAKDANTGVQTVIKRTLVAKQGARFKLNDGLRKNLWLSANPTCTSVFPLLTSERTADVVIEKITLDGNRENNANLNGNYGGCVFLQDCNRYTLRDVTARNYNGDGISFQICHDVIVEGCRSHDNANLGVHPGSGSQRPIIRNCKMSRNDLGLFWCWGVKYGLAEGNQIEDNRRYGISIGHCDTDNVMRNNVIRNSGKVGILFRNDARGADFWAHRNVLENNHVIDSGDDDGIAIDIQGRTKNLRIIGNKLQESRRPMQRVGVRIGPQAGELKLDSNRIEGFATEIQDNRSPKP